MKERIFGIRTPEDFNAVALEIFRYQFEYNAVYRKFAQCFCNDPFTITHYEYIPFLPVEFFKSEIVMCGKETPEAVFRSSGTTGTGESVHYISDLSVYNRSSVNAFEMFYGSLQDYSILALLPSYLETRDSSLVWMANLFMSKSNYKNDCGFFKDEIAQLAEKLKLLSSSSDRKVLLLGVSYALLDFAEMIDFPIADVIVMETGGMKGKRKEIIREELHAILSAKFGVSSIHSEYGMTELVSQAYSKNKGNFYCPPWMKVLIRDINDPLSFVATGRTGGINIVDLANLNSCSFIATQDLGKLNFDGSFEVLGRFDNSDARGCNLMFA